MAYMSVHTTAALPSYSAANRRHVTAKPALNALTAALYAPASALGSGGARVVHPELVRAVVVQRPHDVPNLGDGDREVGEEGDREMVKVQNSLNNWIMI